MATDAELESIETRIIEDVDAGMQSVSVDGMNINITDPGRRLDVLERLENRTARETAAIKPHFGLRFTKLVSPGGGGS